MASILTRTHAPSHGPRVRLRLARPSDAAAAVELLARHGVEATEIEVRRLLAYDPTRRAVICAFAPIDEHETLVGFGAIPLQAGADVETLIAEPPVGRLLARVLRERADSHGRRVA